MTVTIWGFLAMNYSLLVQGLHIVLFRKANVYCTLQKDKIEQYK
jgi:hypothetical protein